MWRVLEFVGWIKLLKGFRAAQLSATARVTSELIAKASIDHGLVPGKHLREQVVAISLDNATISMLQL